MCNYNFPMICTLFDKLTRCEVGTWRQEGGGGLPSFSLFTCIMGKKTKDRAQG